MTLSAESAGQVVQDDGRVELTDSTAIQGSAYHNEELAPVPMRLRRWNTYNYCALWVGMAYNIPSYMLAGGLIALGMDWLQALLTITLGNLLVLVPMLLNSHAGTKYGIPFPVFARAFYGLRGANVPALLRAFIACGWFGIQTWIGGAGIHVIADKVFGDWWSEAGTVGGKPWTLWASFLLFWVIQLWIIWRGMETLKRFENWVAPAIMVVAVVLVVWVLVKAGGFGPILSQESELGWGPEFWKVFFPSLMAMVAFWSTLSLNMPDFTRFGASQRQQMVGQLLGLPTTMAAFALMAVVITSGTVVIFGAAIWDPILLADQFDNPFVVIIALVTVLLATVSTNIAANVVSPSYDFSNVLPKLISRRSGALITGVLGVVIMPWRLLETPGWYIFAWLTTYGGLLGSVAGVLIGGYWVQTRTRLNLVSLYRADGRYWFSAGFNWRAMVATAVGMVLAVGGANSTPGDGPFPEDGLIPFLEPLYDFSWAVGLVASLLVFVALSGWPRRPAPAMITVAGTAAPDEDPDADQVPATTR